MSRPGVAELAWELPEDAAVERFVMSITKEDKSRLISEYRRDDADSGSPEVQVAVLTHRINALTEHLRGHDKDHAGRKGLLALVSKRRRHLNYLARTAPQTYQELVQRLQLRK